MRFVASAAVFAALSLTGISSSPCAFGINENAPDATVVAALESKANQAQPKDRCFLYAELVNRMGEMAGRQFGAGDPERASATLILIQQYAAKIEAESAVKTEKLKNAELLMQRTCLYLKDVLGSVSYENRDALQTTLTQLGQVQNKLMMQVFKR